MKKLYKHIALYLLPILVVIIALPINNKLKYLGLEDDCFNHGIWMYDRIYENDKPVDVAFLGSSHTINGVNDELIENELVDLKIANFGYCRLGRNLTYVLLKEILKEKKLKYLVIEVREEENRYSHPIFPHLAGSKDVMLANPLFNKDILSDMWTHLAYKIELFQDFLYKETEKKLTSSDDFGFTTSPDTASIEILSKAKEKRSKPKRKMSKFEQDFHSKFARVYLKKVYQLCEDEGVKLCFLYLPGYGRIETKPLEANTYESYGEILYPPKNIFDNVNHWHDENHLNEAGAEKLSKWLAQQIKQRM